MVICEEDGVVKGVHLLSGEVRSVTTALKVVEEKRRKCKRLKMNEKKSHDVVCNHDDKNLTAGLCAHGITREPFMC